MSDLRSILIERISDFFRKEFKGDMWSRVQAMKITAIEHLSIQDKCCMIKLKRPGLLIGLKGTIINRLEKFIDCKVYIVEDTSTEVFDEIISPTYIDYDSDDDLDF